MKARRLIILVAVLLMAFPATSNAYGIRHWNRGQCHRFMNHNPGVRLPAYCYIALNLEGGLLIGGPR